MTGVPYPLAPPPFAESGTDQLSGEKLEIQGWSERAVVAAPAQADLLIVARDGDGAAGACHGAIRGSLADS